MRLTGGPGFGRSLDFFMWEYPEELDREPVGFPVIQYRETHWEFIRRLANRSGLPETGTTRLMSCLGYTARIDRKFYQAGGEQEGRDRRQYRTSGIYLYPGGQKLDVAEAAGKAEDLRDVASRNRKKMRRGDRAAGAGHRQRKTRTALLSMDMGSDYGESAWKGAEDSTSWQPEK